MPKGKIGTAPHRVNPRAQVLHAIGITITFPGAGYNEDTYIGVVGGQRISAARFHILSVDELGGILAIQIDKDGRYTVIPGNPATLKNPSTGVATARATIVWEVL